MNRGPSCPMPARFVCSPHRTRDFETDARLDHDVFVSLQFDGWILVEPLDLTRFWMTPSTVQYIL